MLRLILCILITSLFSLNAFAAIEPAKKSKKYRHVIYITLDGTRWQDVFSGRKYFRKLWDKYALEGAFYGTPGSNTKIEVASIPISLPSYQSQMSGEVQPCNGNGCGRITVETFPERLVSKLHLNKKDVATFASWRLINYSVEHIDGATYTNTGNAPVYDPDTNVADTVMQQLNEKQMHDQESWDYRHDKYTFAQALHYFETYKPLFMWISLGDADEAAHRADILRYGKTLRFYDEVIDLLFETLKKHKIDQDTLVIITTDHGRGNGIHWTSHGPEYPESKLTWAFVMNGELSPIAQTGDFYYYNSLSIRPTVEKAFGI